MRRANVDLLCCPRCRGDLTAERAGGGERLEQGELACGGCGRRYPIAEGIPRFLRVEELTGPNRSLVRLYDRFARVYDPAVRCVARLVGDEAGGRREILARFDPGAGRVLEVSIGTGANLPFLFELPGVREAHGIDVSLGMLRRCRRRCEQRGWDVDLALAQAEALPQRDASFDAVLHVGGINAFTDKEAALVEMVRVARPGACVVIADETDLAVRRLGRWLGWLPALSKLTRAPAETFAPPTAWLPEGAKEMRVEPLWKGYGYCLSFRTPG